MKNHEFNSRPQGWLELSDRDFARLFFQFSGEQSYRQIFYDEDNNRGGQFPCKLFTIEHTRTASQLGYAIMDDWKENRMRFYQFGTAEDWEIFNRWFAGQFAGDNS